MIAPQSLFLTFYTYFLSSLFMKHYLFSGKNVLRPGPMNINVATWGRLMKRALPQNCNETNTLSPPNQITSPGQFHKVSFPVVTSWLHSSKDIFQHRTCSLNNNNILKKNEVWGSVTMLNIYSVEPTVLHMLFIVVLIFHFFWHTLKHNDTVFY